MDKLLILLDQHAVDERIKLEESMMQYLKGDISKDAHCQFHLQFDPSLISVLNRFGTELDGYGFQYKRPVTTNTKGLSITLTRRFLHPSNPSKLFFDCLDWIIDCASSSHLIPGQIPAPILTHFKSKACRGAIMFGDELSQDECHQLFEKLKSCKTPFQCAHGRPSLVPISLL